MNLIYAQRQYWKCLQYQGTFSLKNSVTKSTRHIPSIKFIGSSASEKENAKATRDCYAVLTPEQEKYFATKLTRLKNGKV